MKTKGYADSSAARPDQAAIFVDYDNLFAVLEAQSDGSTPPSELVTEILQEVRRYLEEGDDTPTILGRSYADFTGLPTDTQDVISRLHRMGIEPINTPDGPQPNASEINVCMDVMANVMERPDLRTFVIVTGDRPYLPLVRRIREQGRRALVAAVNPPRTDLEPAYAEDDAYLDARNLLSKASREVLTGGSSSTAGGSGRREPRRSRSERQSSPPPRRYRSLTNPTARRTIAITEEHFGQYKEVYLTPLLRKLSDVLGEQHDPKSLVSELEAAGAVRLEKRDGYPYDYTVLIVNEDHPDVQEIQDDFYTNRSDYSATDNGHSAGEPSTDESRADAYADDTYDEYEDDFDDEDYGEYEDPRYADAPDEEDESYADSGGDGWDDDPR